MITSMQTFFAKHYRWMLVLIMAMVAIPFIFAYGPTPTLDPTQNRNSNSQGRRFFGQDLSNETAVQELARMAAIESWLKTGLPPYDPEALQTLVLERIVELDLVSSLDIPHPTTQQLASYMGTLPPFQDDKGNFSRTKFNEFNTRFASDEGLSKDYLADRIATRWRIDQITDRLAAGYFILPTSLQREYQIANTRYTLDIATLKLDNNLKIELDEAALRAYYQANSSRYYSPELRQGTVYSLPASRFAAQVTPPTPDQLQKFFDSISFRFIQWQVTDEKGQTVGAAPKAPTLDEHRQETERLYAQAKAARAAAEAVDAIVSKIYQDKIAPGTPAWEALVKASGLQTTPIGPVAANASDADGTVERLFASDLAQRPYSEAYMGQDDGRFVLLTQITPSAPQAYEAVAQQVKTDATAQAQQKEFAKIAQEKIGALKLAAQGTYFTDEANRLGFTIAQPEVFTLSQPASQITTPELVKGLVTAQAGEIVSDIGTDTVTVILVKGKDVPAMTPDDSSAQELQSQMQRAYSRLTVLGYLNEWAQKHGGA